MKLRVLQGKFFRNFIHVFDIKSTKDLEHIESIKLICSRTEYKPFSKSYNKNVSRSFYYATQNLFPAQFLQDVKEKFLKYHPEIELIDEHLLYDQNFSDEYFDEWLSGINLPPNFSVTTPEYVYQKESVMALLYNKYGRIKIGTGGGKTLIMYLTIKYLLDNVLRKITDGNNKILIIINRVDLILQTKREFEDKFDAINIINDNEYSVPLLIESIHTNPNKLIGANVIIATWNSIANYDKDWFSQFKVVMSDEAHTAKAYSIETKIYEKLINMEYSMGFTGTWHDWNTLDYLSCVAMFGGLVYQKTTYELIQDNNVSDVIVKRININYSEQEKGYIRDLKERYKDELTGVELYHMECSWIQNHKQRNLLMVKLINLLPNNHLFLVRNISYLNTLKETFEQYCPDREILIIHGGIKTEQREIEKQKMANENKKVMIATNDTMSTGISINNIWYVHNPDGGKSMVTLLQGLGRALRKLIGKEYALYFDYNDANLIKSSYNRQAKVRLEILKNEKHKIEDVDINLKPNLE